VTDPIVKCKHFKMPMRASHCITKCGYVIMGNKPCQDIATAIDEQEAVLIPTIASLPCSAPFVRAFPVDVERARSYATTNIIPAKTKAKPEKAPEPPPAPAPEPAIEKDNKMSDAPQPAQPEAPEAPAAPAVPAAPAATTEPPADPPAAPAAEAPRRGRRKAAEPKPEKDDPMPRGIPNDTTKPRRKKAAALPASGLLIFVETRAGSGKFSQADGDLGKMLALKAAGKRVIVVSEFEEAQADDKAMIFTETRKDSGKFVLGSEKRPRAIKVVQHHEL